MAYVPTRLVTATAAAIGTQQNYYTVPAGKRVIYTDVNLAAGGTSSATGYFCDGNGVGWGGSFAQNVPIDRSLQLRGFYVGMPGDAFNVNFLTGGSAWVQASGLIGDFADTYMGGTPFRAIYNHQSPGTRQLLYQVPANKTAIVKTIMVTNVAATDGYVDVLVNGLPLMGHLEPIGGSGSSSLSSTIHLDRSFVANASEGIHCETAGSPNVSFYVAGILY